MTSAPPTIGDMRLLASLEAAARTPDDDRPRLPQAESEAPAEATNGFSLSHSARFVSTLSLVKAIRTVMPDEAKK